ncbi:MAG: hypothetical protein LR011_07045 [Verrucomicrobia bacterium]|nr:hypothetical protein [Verrucomicrobiota bacterium]
MRTMIQWMRICQSAALLCLVMICAGCKTQPYKSPDSYNPSGVQVHKLEGLHPEKVKELSGKIAALDPSIDLAEAEAVADTSIRKAEILREQYQILGPALMHNFMVNTGFRDRGLCYQWAEDIYPELVELNLRTLQVHRAIALRGHLREHSALVLTANRQSFYDGLVLDAWKYSGALAWIHVKDSKYPWRPFDEIPPEMIEAWEKYEQRKKKK